MWNFVILSVLVALTGFYATIDKEGLAAMEQAKADNYASSMALYRQATITYFTQNPTVYQSVDIAVLRASGAVPMWSALYTQQAAEVWNNYRGPDGVIYIYAKTAPPVNMVAEVLKASHNSELVGVFRTGDVFLYSPRTGNYTASKLPAPGIVPIPDGSPVWIGSI
jgi:hypothetical protein